MLGSIADRLQAKTYCFAGLFRNVRADGYCLPCRRSRVRIPSAALLKASRLRGFPRSRAALASRAFGDFLRLLSFHRPRAFLGVGMRPAAGRGSGPGLTAGQQPEGLVDRAAEDLLELLRAVPPRSSTCW